MVHERFKHGDARRIGERFRREGRLLPEEVTYLDSWVDVAGKQCFQLVDAPDLVALSEWMKHWADLVDFDVVPVLTSAEFWS